LRVIANLKSYTYLTETPTFPRTWLSAPSIPFSSPSPRALCMHFSYTLQGSLSLNKFPPNIHHNSLNTCTFRGRETSLHGLPSINSMFRRYGIQKKHNNTGTPPWSLVLISGRIRPYCSVNRWPNSIFRAESDRTWFWHPNVL